MSGPMTKTLVDLWRLVWQEKPQAIVMVTNLKEGDKVKCQQYWPDASNEDYGPFTVTLLEQQIFTDYTIRTFQVKVSLKVGNTLTYNHILFIINVHTCTSAKKSKFI